MTEEEIRETLKEVIDPELGINIVDLGLIYGIKNIDGHVHIEMTLTTPGCPLHSTMETGIQYALHEHADISSVEVELVWEPKWTPESMTPEGKRMLWG
ncbi:MAG TPA: metal-sulfur cluster assembly factor [Bacillales bacterium]|nr:metal-sulfur cluster assembly factor [Bacillales bacterium]